MNLHVCIRNGLVFSEDLYTKVSETSASIESIRATIVANMARYGYVLSKEAYDHILRFPDQIIPWWESVEPVLSELSGSSRRMEKFVVYKNFPKEVLDMSQTEYWTKQILMYWGFHKDNFTQVEKPRPTAFDRIKPKVLHLATEDKYAAIYENLLKQPSTWTPDQKKDIDVFISEGYQESLSNISFKENMIYCAIQYVKRNLPLDISTATDALRLAVGMSGGDITFENNTRLRNFSRPERRAILSILERSTNLEEDIARDKERFKRLFRALHAGDYEKQFPRVYDVIANVYNKSTRSFAAKVEMLKNTDDLDKVLRLLVKRPGEFVRQIHSLYTDQNSETLSDAVCKIIPDLTVIQKLKLKKYLLTVNDRKTFTIAPKGNWSKLKILENTKATLKKSFIKSIVDSINFSLRVTLAEFGIGSVYVADKTKDVKIQTNKASALPYGRGTTFFYGENIKFIRTASYWKHGKAGNVWFDNGVNFFSDSWSPVDTLCWNNTQVRGALFSGDPCTSQEMKGRACQMIDLYPEKLMAQGIRYAVWNILCFSKIPFSKAEDVYASIQLGENAESGSLFEPSRCQMSFPITDDSYTKYIACIDLVERKIIYLDANLKANVRSALYNADTLSKQMPAFFEYLDSLPSIHDLFSVCDRAHGTPILYSDAEYSIKGGQAYVFQKQNKNNVISDIDLNKILST